LFRIQQQGVMLPFLRLHRPVPRDHRPAATTRTREFTYNIKGQILTETVNARDFKACGKFLAAQNIF